MGIIGTMGKPQNTHSTHNTQKNSLSPPYNTPSQPRHTKKCDPPCESRI